jgi:hypothetical protein
MSLLVMEAYLTLIQFDFCLARKGFSGLHDKVRRCPICTTVVRSVSVEQVCSAMEMACIWYWKQALCLQRSAATACLLRRCGVAAELVTGVQQMPFRAHAWVEVAGRVVNDRPYLHEMYAVLDKC